VIWGFCDSWRTLFLKPNTNFNILASLDFKASFNSGPIHFDVTASVRECLVAVFPWWEWLYQNASFIRNAEALHLVCPVFHPDDNAGFMMSFSPIADGDCLNVDEPEQDVRLKMRRGRLRSRQDQATTEERGK